MDTPREIVRNNAAAYLVAHTVVCGLALATNARLFWFTLAILGPWFALSTYRSAVRSWRGERPDPVREISLPALMCAAVAAPFYWPP